MALERLITIATLALAVGLGACSNDFDALISDAGGAPASGTIFFLADAESGTLEPPWPSWGHEGQNGGPTLASERVKNGSWAWKFEIVGPTPGTNQTFMHNTPQVKMCELGHFCSG